MTNKKKLIVIISVLILAVAALILVWTVPFETSPASQTNVAAEDGSVTVRLKAVGDNLMHSPVFKSCETDNGYDFSGLYKNIRDDIKDADIKAINQETIFVGSGYSGYPQFGTPHQVGDSVHSAGFNVITHATNHTYDKGENAILYTMDFWKKYNDVTVLGINKTQAEQNAVNIWKKGDLSIAMLNFTYGLNGFRLPEEAPYLVNLLECGALELSLLKQAEERADITVVFVHFGTEYVHEPTQEQIDAVEFLTVNGADIIIGTHPHVVQPMTKHIAENGNEAIVYYSLGNFLSNQSGAAKILGAMADVTITKKDTVTTIENYAMHPTVTHCSNGKYTAYMLEEYTDELAQKHTRAPGLTVEKLKTLYNKIINIEVK